ncbi:MAG: fibronectin type III domain-containing protein, partial [Candidatus Nealsonbacteria bacterium]
MKDKYLKTKNNYLILISLICLMGTLLFPDFSSAACDAGHIDNLDGTCTATFYPNADPETSSIDGSAGQGGGANLWNSLVAGTGNDYQSSQTSWEVALIYSYAPDGNWYYLRRGIFLFDTSALPDDANISAATLSIRGQGKVDNLNINPNVNIYSSAPASNNVIVPGDFDSFGSTAFCDTPITYAGWSTTGYNDFILNAAGMAAISKTGVSKFGTRNVNYDVANIEPTWSSTKDSRLYGYYAEAGEGYQPKLVVTYTDESSDTTPPVISSISAASIAETSAQINWTTNEGATSQVEYGTTISYGSLTTLNSNLVTSRLLTLTGLSSNTLYYYRVRSKDASDNEAISSNQTFSTLSPPPPPPLFWSGWGAINTIYYNPSQEDPDNPFLYTAAQDLRTYLQQMSGRSWTVVTNASPAPPAIYLSVNAAQLSGRGDEAFRLVANGNGVTITCKTAIACR